MGCCLGTLLWKASDDCSDEKVSSSENPRRSHGNTSQSTRGSTSHSSVKGEWTEEFPNGMVLPVPRLRMFTFAELKSATRNFKPETIIGEGGFGKVYKGWMDEKNLNPVKSGTGMMVAIKKLNPESMQGLQEWQSEVNFLGRLSHPNLVKLLGYCLEDTQHLLVYEFMAKGSLENHLFRGPTHEPLSWALRLKIAIGAARGLAFLHSSEKKIIYRDFKASNILLDSNYNVKLSDFGLAKHGPQPGKSHVTTRVMGTSGYAAPEYVATGRLYIKSDVYGFGVVLLEMLSGQCALDTDRPNGQQNLVEWAKPFLGDRSKVSLVMDKRLEGKYPFKAAGRAAELTLKCLASDPKSRPSMDEVVETLEQIKALPNKTEGKPVAAPHKPRGYCQAPTHHRSPRHALRDNSGSLPAAMRARPC